VITIASISKEEQILSLIAYEKNVFTFRFTGDQTYTDDQGANFYWAGVLDEAPVITAVRFGTEQYTEVTTIQDCIDNEGTFFYDSPDLYVHHLDNAHDIAKISDARFVQQRSIFASYGFDRMAKGYYDKTYYNPGILNVSGLSISADPLKLGLISFGSGSITLLNADGEYDDLEDEDVSGNNIEFFTVPGGQGTTDDANIIFEGIVNGADKTESGFSFNIEEKRFFYDAPVCPNVSDITDYPDIDNRFEGKPLPVAFGDVRRAPVLAVNTEGVKKSDSATVELLLADPALGEIRQVDAIYDDDDNEITSFSFNSATNIVTHSKPSGTPVNFSKWSWRGQGYDIDGTYNNGLDIMRFCLTKIAGLSYVAGVFNIDSWDAAAVNNTQAIGIASNSSRGITTEIIQPITVSLQSYVLSDNTGQLSFFNRNTDANFSLIVEQEDLFGSVDTAIDSENIVSGLRVEYAPSFVDDQALQVENIVYREQVIESFGIDRYEPLSPVKSVLVNDNDAIALSEEVLETSIAPERRVNFTIAYNGQTILPFEMLAVDVGRYGDNDYKAIEVLSTNVNVQNYTIQIEGRIIGDADVLDRIDGGTAAIEYDDIIIGGFAKLGEIVPGDKVNSGFASDSFTDIYDGNGATASNNFDRLDPGRVTQRQIIIDGSA
jgi:hypothetical protein